MAKIVGGFLMPHDPLIAGAPQAVEPAKRDKVKAAFETIAGRVRELQADTVIVIGDDHYAMFGPHCIPRCLIAIGDVEGPMEDWLGIKRGTIENNEPLARHILNTGFADGIDWSFAKSLTVDHAITVPHHFCIRSNPGLRTIPIYLNAGVSPVISSRRAYDIGCNLRKAVESWDRNERVVVFGTGGISHWVGSLQMGRVNEVFDRQVLGMAEQGDVDGLIALSDDYILEQGGNGALEVKNWICAMAALGSARASLIAYEPIPEWITGIGFAELKMAA